MRVAAVEDHVAFFMRVEHDGAGAAEHRMKHRHVDGGVRFGGGHQNGSVAGRLHGVIGRPIAIRKADPEVVAVAIVGDPTAQRRAEGPLLIQPAERLRSGVPAEKHLVLELPVAMHVARSPDRESPHGHTVYLVEPGRIGVCPGQIVFSAGRDDLDIVVRGEELGDEAAMELGTSSNLQPVSLYYEGEPHRREAVSSTRCFRGSPRCRRAPRGLPGAGKHRSTGLRARRCGAAARGAFRRSPS